MVLFGFCMGILYLCCYSSFFVGKGFCRWGLVGLEILFGFLMLEF